MARREVEEYERTDEDENNPSGNREPKPGCHGGARPSGANDPDEYNPNGTGTSPDDDPDEYNPDGSMPGPKEKPNKDKRSATDRNRGQGSPDDDPDEYNPDGILDRVPSGQGQGDSNRKPVSKPKPTDDDSDEYNG